MPTPGCREGSFLPLKASVLQLSPSDLCHTRAPSSFSAATPAPAGGLGKDAMEMGLLQDSWRNLG